jgi:hypothetical protein
VKFAPEWICAPTIDQPGVAVEWAALFFDVTTASSRPFCPATDGLEGLRLVAPADAAREPIAMKSGETLMIDYAAST